MLLGIQDDNQTQKIYHHLLHCTLHNQKINEISMGSRSKDILHLFQSSTSLVIK